MSNKSLVALIVAVVVAIVAWNSFYIVSQTERADRKSTRLNSSHNSPSRMPSSA